MEPTSTTARTDQGNGTADGANHSQDAGVAQCPGAASATNSKGTHLDAPETAEQLALLGNSVGYDDTIKALLSQHCESCHSTGKSSPDLSNYAAAAGAAKASAQAIESGAMPLGGTLPASDVANFQAWVANGMPQTTAAGGAATPSPTPASTVAPVCVPNASGPTPIVAAPSPGSPAVTPKPSPAPWPVPSPWPSPVLPSPVLPSPVLPSPVLPSPVLPSPVLPSPVLPSPVLPSPIIPSPTPLPAAGYTNNIKAILDSRCVGCHGSGGRPPNLSTYAAAAAAGPSSLSAITRRAMPLGGSLSNADSALFIAWANAGYPETAP